MKFLLPKKEWIVGDTIEGKVSITPHKNIEATAVKVELVYLEFVPYGQGNRYEESVELELAQETQFQSGQPQLYPFRLTIPDPAPASAHYKNGSISWMLRGTLDRPRRVDTFLQEEVLVYPKLPE